MGGRWGGRGRVQTDVRRPGSVCLSLDLLLAFGAQPHAFHCLVRPSGFRGGDCPGITRSL